MPHSKGGKKRIRISGPATRDLASIGAYTQREWGKRQKTTYLSIIKNKFSELRDTPGMGMNRDDVGDGLRAHPVGKHVVFYRDTEAALIVIRVLHQNMDPRRHLGSKDD